MKKFDLEEQWQIYLQRVGMKETQMHPIQAMETKRAFVAGLAQMFEHTNTNQNEIGEIPLDEKEEVIQASMDELTEDMRTTASQISGFWKQESLMTQDVVEQIVSQWEKNQQNPGMKVVN